MLSVIIPTEGAEHPAVATLAALIPGAAAGVVREVLLVDRGGNGVIERVADVAGCRYLAFEGSRAAALAAGARQARSPYSERSLRDGLKGVARMIAGPFADQGLLIARDHYERLGGYAENASHSEARLLRRLGRSSLTLLHSRIIMA